MPSDVFEEPIELEIDLLQAGAPTVDSYPYPSLSLTGRKQTVTFESVILENPFLRATFLPALGGRLVSLLDKRSGAEVLSPKLEAIAGGRRGVDLRGGIQLHLEAGCRLTSLAAVQFAAEESDEDQPAGLWMGESVTGNGLSWHLHASLPADSAALRLEARIFNRTFENRNYQGGIVLPTYSRQVSQHGSFIADASGNGVAIIQEVGGWAVSDRDGQTFLSRFGSPRALAARQLDTWILLIVPFSGLDAPCSASKAGVLSLDGGSVKLQAASELRQHKLVILTSTGQTLEAPIDAYPDRTSVLELPGEVSAVAVMDASKQVVLQWESAKAGQFTHSPVEPADAPPPEVNHAHLEHATFHIATRHAAHALLGLRALGSSDFGEADHKFEQSLLTNGEDHLTWWLKALARRLGNDHSSDEAPELLNAHYLAPLEPVLRAESFLGRPATMEKAPDPLLKPLDEHPEAFVEVASLLLEAKLYEQASRWLDEALRHVDLAMLHYLMAFAHVRATGLTLDAAEHMAAAANLPFGPPYPWRPIELEAIVVLKARFPDDARLEDYARLMALLQTS